MTVGEDCLKPRLRFRLAILLALVGCQDAVTPLDQPNVAGLGQGILGQVVGLPTPPAEMHIPRQSPTAPPLETYQVSFWARKDKASTVIVNYQPAAEESAGQPFLRFDIPAGGLKAGPDEPHLDRRDSVFITLTIDPDNFSVEFQPSGVVFSKRHPARLVIWYENANPDLNGDGVVDAADEVLGDQLALWTRHERPAPWRRLLSASDPALRFVYTELRHFSEYAISW